ncbi:hypothetical protein PRIPAC_96512, partial [Pristionchus pacificus]
IMESDESPSASRHPNRRKAALGFRSHRSNIPHVLPRISDVSYDPDGPSTSNAVRSPVVGLNSIVPDRTVPSSLLFSDSEDSDNDEQQIRERLRATPNSRKRRTLTTIPAKANNKLINSSSSKPLRESKLLEVPEIIVEDYDSKKYKKLVRLSPRLEEDSPDKEICENDAADSIKYELVSPVNGESLTFNISDDTDGSIVESELVMHLSHVCMSDDRIKDEFEREFGKDFSNMQLQWRNYDECMAAFDRLNRMIANFTVPHTDSKTSNKWFSLPVLTAEQCKTLAMMVYNRAVKKASVLNTCYEPFSSQVYGETSFEQLQIIFDHLKLTEKHVFVDLGSGVGQVVTYAAAFSRAKCVGIEINAVPAKMAVDMKKEMMRMMAWYGKDCGDIEMRWSSLLNFKHRGLITKEADVIYVNNYAFDPPLMHCLKELILLMKQGTRIVCTKSITERKRQEKENEEIGNSRLISNRTFANRVLTVDMILDAVELPLAEAPVSWATGKDVQFILYTVNYLKLEELFKNIPEVNEQSDENRVQRNHSQGRGKESLSTKYRSIGSQNSRNKDIRKMKECNRNLTRKDVHSHSTLPNEIGAAHGTRRVMKRKIENEQRRNNLSHCSRMKKARVEMDTDKYDFSLDERIFAKYLSADTAVFGAVIENIEVDDDGPCRYRVKFDGEDGSFDNWVYKDELHYLIFSEYFILNGGFVEGDDRGVFVGSYFTGGRDCRTVQKETYKKGELFLCKNKADAIVAWPAKILRVEKVHGRNRYYIKYKGFTSKDNHFIEPYETNLEMEKYSREKHDHYKKVNKDEIAKKTEMKKISTITRDQKKGMKKDWDRTKKEFDSIINDPFPLSNEAQNDDDEKAANEVEKKERKEWKAFSFNTTPVSYYPFHVSDLLKIHKQMPVGAEGIMWWENVYYKVTCIAKATKNECEKLILDLINGDRTLDFNPPQEASRGRRNKRKRESKAIQKKARVKGRDSENDDGEIDTTGKDVL